MVQAAADTRACAAWAVIGVPTNAGADSGVSLPTIRVDHDASRRSLRTPGTVVNHLSAVLRGHEPLRLHVLEDDAPAFATFFGGDLIEREPASRGHVATLRGKKRTRDLLLAGRETIERTTRHLRRRRRDVRADERQRGEAADHEPNPHAEASSGRVRPFRDRCGTQRACQRWSAA